MTEETLKIDTGAEDTTVQAEEVIEGTEMTQEEQLKAGFSNYVYRGRCVRVVDGDTYDILVDCGFGIYHRIRVRLRGVDTPEKYGRNACEEGKQVSELVHGILFDQEVMVRTYKNLPKSYDRWVADVFFKDENGVIINLGKFLTANDHAEAVPGYTL
jgi:micrococcal nuclease